MSKAQGQMAYEADMKARPNYHDGTPRKTWDQLCEVAQWSWNRPEARQERVGNLAWHQ